MAHILAVGIATLDIINTVASYPDEDAEIRTLSQTKTRGGNATNTLTVLSQLQHQCTWAGVLVDESDSQFIKQDLSQSQIDYSHCRVIADGKMPTSYITVSQATGSRTIVHHRDCPEFSFDDFLKLDLSNYDWIHFEGRNVPETKRMLEHLKKTHPNIPCSLEVEKARPDIENCFDLPSILLFSHDYARSQGFTEAIDLLKSLKPEVKATCTWGDQGAWAKLNSEEFIHHSPNCTNAICDTLGAGDTFNAGLINGLVRHNELNKALIFATELASHKCTQQGLKNLLTDFKFTMDLNNV